MLKPYIKNYIHEIRTSFKETLLLDVVFEGGLFNGSYLAGCLFYLKEMENQKLISVQRLSGCSIGAITALLYFIDNEEIMLKIYQLASKHFKAKYDLDMFTVLFDLLREHLPGNILENVNGKLYICYYNVKTRKQVIKNHYQTIDELFETIRRSCSFPYVIDQQIFYHKKYIDGLYPHVFQDSSKNVKVLYLNIHHLNKIGGMISIKNEDHNIHRILEGMIETHIFFLTGKKTNLCSFTNDWNLMDRLHHSFFVIFMEVIFILLHYIYVVQNIVQHSQKKHNGSIDFYKLVHGVYIYLLKTYCI